MYKFENVGGCHAQAVKMCRWRMASLPNTGKSRSLTAMWRAHAATWFCRVSSQQYTNMTVRLLLQAQLRPVHVKEVVLHAEVLLCRQQCHTCTQEDVVPANASPLLHTLLLFSCSILLPLLSVLP
jgi:hypothetical protein